MRPGRRRLGRLLPGEGHSRRAPERNIVSRVTNCKATGRKTWPHTTPLGEVKTLVVLRSGRGVGVRYFTLVNGATQALARPT